MRFLMLGITFLLYLGWGVLLYRLHLGLERCDPQRAAQAGKPHRLWTPFIGHRVLVEVIYQPQPGHAPLRGLIGVMRIWAALLVLVSVWMVAWAA